MKHLFAALRNLTVTCQSLLLESDNVQVSVTTLTTFYFNFRHFNTNVSTFNSFHFENRLITLGLKQKCASSRSSAVSITGGSGVG